MLECLRSMWVEMPEVQNEPQHWWTRPKAAVALACTALATLAGVITSYGIVKGFFGGLNNTPIQLVFNADYQPATRFPSGGRGPTTPYFLIGNYEKSGDGVLHKCFFNIWVDGEQADITNPSKPFEIGDKFQSESISLEFSVRSMPHDTGTVSLSCDAAITKALTFKFQ
jgi:hypothetical protein